MPKDGERPLRGRATLADNQQENRPQSYSHKELNPANNPMSLEEDLGSRLEHSPVNSLVSALQDAKQRIQLYHAHTSDPQNWELINECCLRVLRLQQVVTQQ